LIWINEPGRVFVARRGRSELTTTILGEAQVRDLVERMRKTTGRRVDLSTPFVDAMLPDGSRLHVVIPDITRRHWSVNIRKFVLSANTLDELVMLGTVTDQAARFLEAAIVAGLNVIVAGGTQAGKTTLLNCLAGAIPAKERVVTCEEVFELPNVPEGRKWLGWRRTNAKRPGPASNRRSAGDPTARGAVIATSAAPVRVHVFGGARGAGTAANRAAGWARGCQTCEHRCVPNGC